MSNAPPINQFGLFVSRWYRLGYVWEVMACVATWAFGLIAVETAARTLEAGADCVDAVEAAVNGCTICLCVCVCNT